MNNQPSRHFSTSCRTSVFISDACIKGSLAFAATNVFSLDPSFPEFYDSNSSVSIAITDQYAHISILTAPVVIEPPYILVIGGSQAINLNTGKPPVISKLVTVVTQEMLDDNRPIYATPLTTLAVHMAKDTPAIQKVAVYHRAVIEAFAANLHRLSSQYNIPTVCWFSECLCPPIESKPSVSTGVIVSFNRKLVRTCFQRP